MNKFFASVTVVALFAIGIVAMNSSSSWEPVDVQSVDAVGGGTCYLYTTINPCEQGSDAGCEATLCNWHSTNQRWTCPVNTDGLGYPIPQKISKADVWFPDVKTAESGLESYVDHTTNCTESQTCEGCELSGTDDSYRCRTRSTSVSDTHNGKKLSGNLCL